MKVIGLKVGQTVTIGNNILVTLAAIKSDKARLGIVAPREIPVHRIEVAERIALKASAQTEAK